MKVVLLVLLPVLFFLRVEASSKTEKNYFDKSEKCLLTSDLEGIQGHFQQFQKFTRHKEPELCAQQMGDEWLQVAKALLAMKKIKVDGVKKDGRDDLTRRVIAEKNWWLYFKQRANLFQIRNNCGKGIVAYVQSFGLPLITLCEYFFQMDVPLQLETLMHEVRHFDGFGHTTCTRGLGQGVQGACDEKITDEGSYAVSVQSLVELSFLSQLSPEQKAISEASAIFTAMNHFNTLPTVRSSNYVYLSNIIGEVWKGLGSKGSLGDLELVGQLEEPSRIFSSGSMLYVYPLNLEKDAYQVTSDLSTLISDEGRVITAYNKEPIEKRVNYKTFSYLGHDIFVRNNELVTSCTRNRNLKSTPFIKERIKSLTSIETSPFQLTVNIMGKSGDLYEMNCNLASGQLSTEKLSVHYPPSVKNSFTVEGVQYALTDSGELNFLDSSEDIMEPKLVPALSIDDYNFWVSATPVREFEVFNENQPLSQHNDLSLSQVEGDEL